MCSIALQQMVRCEGHTRGSHPVVPPACLPPRSSPEIGAFAQYGLHGEELETRLGQLGFWK